jgi:hypothetical protein
MLVMADKILVEGVKKSECRRGCGMCCIAPSINRAIPGMPAGKPAGVMCVNLDPQTYACSIWGHDDYPLVCKTFQASPDVCGSSRDEAERLISYLEQATLPD